MTTHPEFDIKTSGLHVAETYADQIKGKTILITGVSPNGIGAATATAIASQSPALLILASRTPTNLSTVVSSLHESYPTVRIEPLTLDLASQASIRAVAAQVAELTPKLDILINNAGLSVMKRFDTAEGIEGQFGTNHVGPFLLTNLLLPLLEKAAKEEGRRPGETRIVNLASGAHVISPIRWSDYNLEGKEVPEEEKWRKGLPEVYLQPVDGYLGIVAYGQSKTANILFTVSLQREVPKKGISAYCLHPGGVRTQLGREQDDDITAAIEKTASYWKDIDQGSSTTLVAALDPALDTQTGLYLDNCQFSKAMPHATDPVAADRLWALSEELVGEKFTL
ncbi:hypothetical protein SAPIO_CDS0772 [Scedosporium apiospermum]|uniref:Short-chain dehydrogenase n=1 Tax=Pseudallescheria apiosperma TaxID=563466 RepID=A0A084GGI3_PSEDA|nr:uncharacterized protein SAPIO_CDS0772 [Scedosporium apiospermum]KEZ46445.1 hypothetical protein SAPIO_CDS0772 [Scedosporium apiospermum]